MQTACTKDELRALLAPVRGRKIVLVPTMGALHEGHASLLRQARELAGTEGCVVASVFLNPVQFDNAGDLATYPQTPEADLQTCRECGVDVVFMPTPDIMYCGDRSITLEETHLSTVLCGAKRPGHFAGVCLVVNKLFNLVQPTDAIFGKNDYQQLAILRRMVRDLDIPITIHGAEIVRDTDGLALSSRNVRLTPEHRAAAPGIRRVLLAAAEAYGKGAAVADVTAGVVDTLSAIPGVKVDYVELVDAENLHAVTDETRPALLAVAAFFGDVRLIDNIELTRNL
ncbi:MAG: pantoate--beta-alanine ligase [Akkermansia sp.]|nr:pantoate--beta-alanine ligase [Akkermansia sp.]